jgi:Icc-related predicted phosphoesterase
MVELRTLHFTDIEDDYHKAQAVLDFVKDKAGKADSIDAVIFTGDMIKAHPQEGADKTAGRVAKNIQGGVEVPEEVKKEVSNDINNLKKFFADNKINPNNDLEALSEAKQDELKDLYSKLNEKILPYVIEPVHESYKAHGKIFGQIVKETPVYAVMGNHDLNIGYDILKKEGIKFLEKTKEETLKGKNGSSFTLKGDINTCEIPRFYAQLEDLFEEYFIPYESGQGEEDLDQELRTLREKILMTKDDKEAEKLEAIKQARINDRVAIRTYQKEARERLGSVDDVDIYLTHRLPTADKARSDIVGSLGDITKEYSANAYSVHGGYFHDGQIGYHRLVDVVETMKTDDSLEKITVDGEDIPVFELDNNQPWHLNAGPNHFLVTEYDTNKNVEQVIVYEFQEVA